jgi:hypothetical protein
LNIHEKLSITLSEGDVKEIVANYLTHKGYQVTADDISFHIGRDYEGYGPMEYEVLVFKKCVAVVKGVKDGPLEN